MADDNVGAALTGMLADFLHKRKAAEFAASEPQGADLPMPELSVESRGIGRPRIGGELNVPALGGEVGVRGSYQKPDTFSPTDIAALLQYHRRF